MPLLRNFTAFYGTASSILYRMCSITFFDFYAIHMIGLRQKIVIFVTFAKLLRGDIHKTLCDDTSVRQSCGFFLLASENGSFVSIEEVI